MALSNSTNPNSGFIKTTLLVLTLLFGYAVTPAQAANLQAAKAAGQIGERLDGYCAVVDKGAKPDIHQLAKTINAKRRAQYERIARKNGVTVADVGRLTAAKVIKNAPKGTFIQQAGGKWVRK